MVLCLGVADNSEQRRALLFLSVLLGQGTDAKIGPRSEVGPRRAKEGRNAVALSSMSRRFQFNLESIFRLMTLVAIACVTAPLALSHIRANAFAYEAMIPVGGIVFIMNGALFWFIIARE